MSLGAALLATLVLALAGCGSFVDKPSRPALYDFGGTPSGPMATPGATASLPPVLLAELDAAGTLEGSAVLYRLSYADNHQLRAYAQARWTAPPAQLVRQRLREVLGRDRIVLSPDESAALSRDTSAAPRVLRLALEEFTHDFETPDRSAGVLRLRATMFESTAAGERLVAQRSITVRRPAASADASGGVRALTEATDAAARELAGWLAQSP